jgi:hypothetical protein
MRSFTDPPNGGKAQLHLKLVHPAPPPEAPKGKRTRTGRRPPHTNETFTPEQEARLRAAFRNAYAQFVTWPRLCKAMGVPYQPIKDAVAGRHRVSAALAVRLSMALKVPLESLYNPPSDAARCPHCGRHGAT